MTEHFETMKDKIFQSEKLNVLFKKYDSNITSFIKDLSDEGSSSIKHTIVRCKKEEPLTV